MVYKQGCAWKYANKDDAYFLQYRQDDGETNKQNLGMKNSDDFTNKWEGRMKPTKTQNFRWMCQVDIRKVEEKTQIIIIQAHV